MADLDVSLVKKIAAKKGKDVQYIREQISRRARRHKVLSSVELAIWRDEISVPIGNYLKKLPPHTQDQFRDYFQPRSKIDTLSLGGLKIMAQRDKRPEHWYNLWWVQVFVVGLLAATISGVLSQILGSFFTNLFGITRP